MDPVLTQVHPHLLDRPVMVDFEKNPHIPRLATQQYLLGFRSANIAGACQRAETFRYTSIGFSWQEKMPNWGREWELLAER
jgi:hypothetical protein